MILNRPVCSCPDYRISYIPTKKWHIHTEVLSGCKKKDELATSDTICLCL